MKHVALMILVLVGTCGCKNLHHIEGNWWRSAQPKDSWLADHIKKNDIDVILNLRGHHPGEKDYDLEKSTADSLGVKLVGIPISANHRLERDKLLSILDFIEEHGDDHVLVHCQGGANRTSLVAFLYLVESCGWEKQRAKRKALSWSYGHFSCPLNPWAKPEIDRFVDAWVNKEWARENYGVESQQNPKENKPDRCNFPLNLPAPILVKGEVP